MTQEEKAKRYDEAFERARAFNNGEDSNIEKGTTICEYIFPELKESEDEKMWKLIKKYAHYNIPDTALNADHITRRQLESWLEKQGKKPQGKSALEAINEEKVDNRNYMKSTNKVKSNFKVGDWITNGEYTWKIISVDYIDYTLQNQNGESDYDTINYVDKVFHLWTIQDAKDGDVLAMNWHKDEDSWEKIIIFKKYHNNGVEGLINSPCVEGYGNTFKNGKPFFHAEVYFSRTWSTCLYPATKEQRDLLFTKMKEDGYKWDANKKELIKEEVR